MLLRDPLVTLVATILFLKVCAVKSDGKSSLAFVIDTTSSMHDDIQQTKHASNEILAIAIKNSSTIENFVLVSFNDPGVQTEIVTTSPSKFQRALSKLRVEGGGDCPEMSMSGIELALEESLPGSFVYVFTDASAKDYDKVDRVKILCQEKQSRVIFVLTGECHAGRNSREYQVYHDIAATSSGQVFHLRKSEVSKVLESVPPLITGKTSVLTSRHLPDGCHTIFFDVDDRTKDITISGSGENLSIFGIQNSIGDRISVKIIVNTKDIKIVSLNHPTPGSYSTTVCSTIGATVVVSAKTDLDFQHGFSEFFPATIDDTTRQPIEGRSCHLAIALAKSENNVGINSVELLDINENLLGGAPIEKIDDHFFVTEAFIPPNQLFKIAIKGYDTETGNPIRRISKTAIQPQKPELVITEPTIINKSPVVTVEEIRRPSDEDDNTDVILLACKVLAYPDPEVHWEGANGNMYIAPNTLPVLPPYEHISYLSVDKNNNEKKYTCTARNHLGTDSKSIEFKPDPVFNILETPSDESVNYGSKAELHCRVESIPPATIQWYFNNSPINTNEKYTISAENTTLAIENVTTDLVGSYQCEVKNGIENMMFNANVAVTSLVPPKLDKTVIKVSGRPGSSLQLTCPVVEGNPEPIVSWYYKLKDSTEYLMIKNAGKTLRVLVAFGNDNGNYRCNADNIVGHDFKDFEIVANQPPKFVRRRGRRPKTEITKGEQVTLPCIVNEEPKPKLKWMKSNKEITAGDKYTISEDNTLSFIADEEDTDEYLCVATNEHGSSKLKHKVNVLVPPNIQKTMPTINVKEKTEMIINCLIRKGNPAPKFKWFYKSKRAKNFDLLTNEENTLTVPMVKVNQGGLYRCVAENTAGNDTYDVNVVVEYPPVSLDDDLFVEVIKGNEAKLPCDVYGVPKPDVKWLKNDEPISGGKYIVDEMDRLRFISDDNDGGTYVCEATNTQGLGKSTVKLNVLAPPEIMKDLNNNTYTAMAGDTDLMIPCKVTGNPKPSVIWKENGQYIVEDSKYRIDANNTLIIKHPVNNSAVACYAGNVHGKDEKIFRVFVEGVGKS